MNGATRPGASDQYCASCGARFVRTDGWPQMCSACGHTAYRNPIPVAVVIQPVGDGVVVIRRGIEPKRGELALPGGYVNHGEDWREAAARELREETGIRIEDPTTIEPFAIESPPDGSIVLLFGLAPPIALTDLPQFTPNAEAMERLIVDRPTALAFPLHATVIQRYFQKHFGPMPRRWRFAWVLKEYEGGNWDIGYDQDIACCVFRVAHDQLHFTFGTDTISRYDHEDDGRPRWNVIHRVFTQVELERAIARCAELRSTGTQDWKVGLKAQLESGEPCGVVVISSGIGHRPIADLERILNEAHAVLRVVTTLPAHVDNTSDESADA